MSSQENLHICITPQAEQASQSGMARDSSEAAVQDRKKIRKRPTWSSWHKDRYANLKDAVALSMDVSPSTVDQLCQRDGSFRKAFGRRLSVALSEAHDKGCIVVIRAGVARDGSDCLIDLRSFVRFAEAREWKVSDDFRRLGEAMQQKSVSDVNAATTCKPTVEFVHALIRLLMELGKAAEREGLDFSPDKMPGTKKDFYAVAKRWDAEFRSLAFSTFDTYLGGLCQFMRGKRHSEFYDQLYEKYLSGKTGEK